MYASGYTQPCYRSTARIYVFGLMTEAASRVLMLLQRTLTVRSRDALAKVLVSFGLNTHCMT